MIFKPIFTITDNILNNLTNIASSREIIEQSYLIPKWEAKLRRKAILHNTHASTAIEGNKLTLEQVEELSEGKRIIASQKDKDEVINYLNALEAISNITDKGNIRVHDLLVMHSMVTKNVLQDTKHVGAFRDKQVYVGSRIFDGTGFKEKVEYMPPKTEDVPRLVQEFLDWINEDKTWEFNSVLLAGITHYEIARIHPFIDGNGRTARLFATLILYLSGFDHRRFFALDDFYDKDRQAYYAALKTAQTNNNDLTNWLDYFTTGVALSVNEVKEVVLKLSTKKKQLMKTQVSLTQKQMQIVEYINIHGKVTNKNLQNIFKISAQAVHKELSKLVDLKVIKSKGKGRSLYYVL